MKTVFATLTVMLLAVPSVLAQDTEGQAIKNSVRHPIKFSSPVVVCQKFRGPVSQIDKSMKQFADEFVKQGLVTPSRTAPVMAIFPRSPENADESIVYEVGFEVQGRVKVKPPLEVRTLALSRAVKVSAVGSYARLFDVHQKIGAAVERAKERRSDGPVVHLYYNPANVSPNKVRTEVLVPIQ